MLNVFKLNANGVDYLTFLYKHFFEVSMVIRDRQKYTIAPRGNGKKEIDEMEMVAPFTVALSVLVHGNSKLGTYLVGGH